MIPSAIAAQDPARRGTVTTGTPPASRTAFGVTPGSSPTVRYMIVSGSSPSAARVLGVEPLDQRLGGEQRAVARGLLDARALVDLVAQRGHLEPPAGRPPGRGRARRPSARRR